MGRTIESIQEGALAEPLDRRIGRLPDVGEFLSLAIAITAAVGEVHARGLIHEDLKPANILVDPRGRVSLTGFGVASQPLRGRATLQPPQALVGSLPYMSPEQTGRMNRSIDSRTDLYSLGVTLYELVTGRLPFQGVDALDWIHCHVARRPSSPLELRPQLPEVIGEILLKLLAKSADERYQTAAGLEADWRRCLEQWELTLRVDPFTLGECDAPDRLIIPEKLYGREGELEALKSACDQAATAAASVLVLVSGYAGVGKSAIVHEARRQLGIGSWFAGGKCDQYERDIPYFTLMSAFAGLARQLLCLPEMEAARWRERLGEALGRNGRIILDLVPELEPIIGPQPPAPEVPPQDLTNRFLRVVRRFLAVFASAEQPLVLFLDDLQWVDAATLDVLGHLLIEPEVRHVLLIGAYRDNEIDSVHPLVSRLQLLRQQGADIREIHVGPLHGEDVAHLVSDALHCPRERATELADLVYSKTHGNPFFTIQFLTSLEQERFLQWRGAREGWWWDTARIDAKGFTENVADLLIGKLARLSQGALEVLQRLACFGGRADPTMLTTLLELPEQGAHAALGEAVAAQLLMRVGGEYRFVHDRVQEAAYSLIPEPDRAPLHLRIGRALQAKMGDTQLAEHVFEIVNQLDRGQELITDPHERRTLAELNLTAGTRARRSSAYAAALRYMAAGMALLPAEGWSVCRELAFKMEFLCAECEFLTGALQQAELRLSALAVRARDPAEGAAVVCLRQTLYAVLGRNERAIEVCLEFLQQQGTVCPLAPTEEELETEYNRLWAQLHGRAVEELAELPEIGVPRQRAILDVLASALAMALMTNGNLFRLMVCRMVNLSLQYGNCDASTLAYSYLNFVIGEQLGDYALGLRFGKLALTLVEKGFRSYKARVEVAYGATVAPWTQPMRTGLPWVRRSVQSAQEAGDLTFACYNWYVLIPILSSSGARLEEVQQEAERALQFARKLRFSYMVDLIGCEVAFLRAVRGFTAELSSFAHEAFDESAYQERLLEDPSRRNAGYMYWVRKLQACFLAEEYVAASAADSRVHEYRWETLQPFERSAHHFYAALTAAARCESLPDDNASELRRAIAAHGEALAAMAANGPENFGSRASLVAAVLARSQGRLPEAEKLYDEAVRKARTSGLLHDEAVALEAAGRHYLARGLAAVGTALLRHARSCYEQWGAIGKIRLLERRFPHLRGQSAAAAMDGRIGMSFLELDAVSVIESARTISSEIVPEMLMRRLLTLSVKQAGAERGLLILVRDGTPRIEAEATTGRGNGVTVEVGQAEPTAARLSTSLLQLVLRTHRRVDLEDATKSAGFPGDDYIRRCNPRSILCQPITRQERLIGILYLENRLVAGLFTPGRMAVLEVLAAQAAISLENAYLYSDLCERESRIRRLFDSNMVGIVFWTLQGAIADANEAFLHLIGYSRESLLAGRLTWHALTPPGYQDHNQNVVEQATSGAIAPPRELELLRLDGMRVPVMIGGTLLEGTEERGVSFVLDLTERRRAELERERRVVAEAANTAKSDFLAAMSHELRTPLNAILGFAQILQRDRALSERHRQQSALIRDSGEHLLKLINDLLDLAKIEAGKLSLNVSEASMGQLLAAVYAATLVKARDKGLELRWHIAPDLPARVQVDERRLRQVLLNLLANAVRFTDRGWVGLSVAPCERTHVRFAVSDSGIGMSADQVANLFQPFTQVGDVEHSAGGTGLGLAISRNLVRLMGGELQVTSAPGAGSTFAFELDLDVIGSRAAEPAPGAVICGYRGPRKSVLVVDDVPESRAVLVHLLESLEFGVAQAKNGTEALNMVRAARPDLVVTDVVMPEMDGRELTRRLRELPDLARVPVIVVSAAASARVEEEWRALGADAFITKPIDTEELLVKLGRLLAIEWDY